MFLSKKLEFLSNKLSLFPVGRKKTGLLTKTLSLLDMLDKHDKELGFLKRTQVYLIEQTGCQCHTCLIFLLHCMFHLISMEISCSVFGTFRD
jgi:hypothetical protein